MHKFLLYFCFVLLLVPGVASAQAFDPGIAVIEGDISAVAELNNTVYVGGNLEYVGANTGAGVPVDLTAGLAKKGFPKMEGRVNASIPDGKGGWFIGGSFKLAALPGITYLAHLNADLTVDASWSPKVQGIVKTLVRSNNTLYVGGAHAVGGLSSFFAGAFDIPTGQATAWNPQPNADVHTIVVTPEGIYVGGKFTRIGGAARNCLARVDPVTGQAMPWNPAIAPGMLSFTYVNTVALHNNLVYVGGSFSAVDGLAKKNLVALDATTAKATAWSPDPNSEVTSLVVYGNSLYVGGDFHLINGNSIPGLASFDATTGSLNGLAPGIPGQVSTLVVQGTTLFIGGNFRGINKESRKNIGAVDLLTGNVTSWSPMTNGRVYAIALAPGAAYVGGDFSSINGQVRTRLAAINAVTGQATNWNPAVSIGVAVIVAVGNRIYVGGNFSTIDGQPRSGIAAFDATTGALTPWNPGQSASVSAIAVTNEAVYLGGWFSNMGGKPRNNLAAVDPITGLATAWNPDANNIVNDILVDRDKIYVAGDFTTIGGAARNHLAAVHPVTGLATGWNPDVNGRVTALALSENVLYAAGHFTSVGGQGRNFLAAVDVLTGAPTAWNPGPDLWVNSIALTGNTVYAGGNFRTIGGRRRARLAALDKTTGQVTDWQPFPEDTFGGVFSLTLTDHAIYTGGSIDRRLHAFGRRPAPSPKRNIIRGNIFADANANCTREAAEDSLANFVVVATPGPYFASTDIHGNYALAVDTGSYTVSQVIPKDKAQLITQMCPAAPESHAVRFTGYNNEAKDLNFANRVTQCPELSVSVASDRRRRCFRSNTTVTYRNDGLGTAPDVQVRVTFPRYVVPVSASKAWKRNADSSYTFEVGALRPYQSGTIAIIDSVVCGMPGIRGLTQCTEARITPVSTCAPPAPHWDQSDVELRAACLDSATVVLRLYNRGTGAMADSSRFRVYLDAQPAFAGAYRLPAGDSLLLRVAARGQTVRLEADQRPGHPGDETSVVTLEACGTDSTGGVSRGFVAQRAVGGANPAKAIDCLPIVDSFDPNDKLVTPAGVTDQHYVPSGKPLTYTVRFQNTGTDVAYRVVVVDTLSPHLDVATLKVGAVSHPYQLAVTGEGRPVLTFTFTNINLPDSNRNEPASHGYLKFSIAPLAAVVQGTRIENFADIFFDYNEPVRTNTTLNTVYDLPEPAPGGGRVTLCGVNGPAAAGPDRAVCEQDTVRLRAAAPRYGSGRWRRVGGGGTFAAPGEAHALVTGLAYGENLFEWAVPANGCATDSLRARVAITRYPKPGRPVVALAADGSLRCEAEGDGYRWYYNESLLPETARTLRPGEAGRYAVQVLRNGCESDRSEAFAFAPQVTGLEPVVLNPLGIHPNPGTGRFYLVTPAGTGPVEVTLSDALGRVVLRRTVPSHAAGAGRYELDLSSWPAGVYLAHLREGNDRKVIRLVKK